MSRPKLCPTEVRATQVSFAEKLEPSFCLPVLLGSSFDFRQVRFPKIRALKIRLPKICSREISSRKVRSGARMFGSPRVPGSHTLLEDGEMFSICHRESLHSAIWRLTEMLGCSFSATYRVVIRRTDDPFSQNAERSRIYVNGRSA